MRTDRARIGRYARAGARWLRLATSRPPSEGVHVSYGHDRIPAAGEPGRGGTAKFQRLTERFPNEPASFNVLYLGSSWLPRDLGPLLRLARRRRIPVVVNQNGVGYPAWAGARADEINRPLRTALRAASHVLYQSEFCKESADLFLYEPSVEWEILPNAVDIDRFTPAEQGPAGGPVLLAAGDQTQGGYRLEVALETMRVLRRSHPGARLVVTGEIGRVPDLAGLDVRFFGRYSQAQAPALFRSAHVLLHTQMNDSCPSVVLEAMACGLPVVHPASGGTVELVGDEGGVGVPHEATWERLDPPEPEALAEAVAKALANLPAYSAAARRRAVERFALTDWLDRHAELFSKLAEGG